MVRRDDDGARPGAGPAKAAEEAGATSGTVGRLPESPLCPFCDGGETEIMNPFGSHASVATYWCRACRSPFEMLKWR